MPEDAERKAMIRELDRLDQVVGLRPAAGDEPLPQLVHPLVVVGFDRDEPLGAGRAGGKRARLEPHLVVA